MILRSCKAGFFVFKNVKEFTSLRSVVGPLSFAFIFLSQTYWYADSISEFISASKSVLRVAIVSFYLPRLLLPRIEH